eukprot:755494-Hanusia_phi.AAC.11
MARGARTVTVLSPGYYQEYCPAVALARLPRLISSLLFLWEHGSDRPTKSAAARMMVTGSGPVLQDEHSR